jgi:hypothetical protein
VKSFLQFLLFVLVITLALAGLYAWKSGQFDRGASAPPAKQQHALPDVKPAIGRGAVPGLAALDEEFTRVAEAVIPSVVSITSRRGMASAVAQAPLRCRAAPRAHHQGIRRQHRHRGDGPPAL